MSKLCFLHRLSSPHTKRTISITRIKSEREAIEKIWTAMSFSVDVQEINYEELTSMTPETAIHMERGDREAPIPDRTLAICFS